MGEPDATSEHPDPDPPPVDPDAPARGVLDPLDEDPPEPNEPA
jgi:hypothetical protein